MGTSLTLSRTASAYVQQASATKKSGANPSTLTVSSVASKAVLTYLGFGIPTEVLLPTTQITDAWLEIYSQANTASTFELRRLTAPFVASSVIYTGKPASDNTLVASVTTGTVVKNGPIRFTTNVLGMIQAMQADSSKNNGFELKVSTAAKTWKLSNTGAYVAILHIEYSTRPTTPTALSPSDNQVVSVAKPTLRIASAQNAGQSINAMQIQVDAAHDAVTPDYDYTQVGTTTEVDLTTAAGAPTLSAHASSAWRTRVRGVGNNWSDWSDWADYTYEPFGTLTITEPGATPDDVVTDPTPPIVWSVSGMTQQAYRLFFTDPGLPASTPPSYDSGVVTSAATTATPTTDVASQTLHTYRVYVRVWDTFNRVVVGGATEFVQAYRDFTYVLTASVDPVTSLSAVDMAPLPFTKLLFSRATPADGYQIIRDGVSIGVFSAADLSVGGDDYEFIDTTAAPRREHTWIVRAIVNGEVSATNPNTGLFEINPAGIWLSQPEKDRYLPFITQSAQAIGVSEDGGTFTILNGNYAVRVFGTQRGWSGTITGEILATELTDTTTGSELFDLFMAMRADQGDAMILSLLDMAIRIVPFNMTISPTPAIGKNGDYVYSTSLEFIEVP